MSLYRLPFDDDSDWQLWNANWDAPGGGHGAGQAYAFDFVHDANHDGTGEDNQNIRAARAGTVIEAKSDRHCNIWQIPDTDPCFGAPGEGNFVLIRHGDGSIAAYCHLMKDKVFVQKDQYVLQGHVIGLSGNTGNSSTAHLHFDVRTFWNSPSDMGPTIPITFEDKNHADWRPKPGDTLQSNNMRTRQDGWRWCSKCQGLFFGDNPGSKCPAGGAHCRISRLRGRPPDLAFGISSWIISHWLSVKSLG